MYHFCTYFDVNYLPRGLALYRSLRSHCASFELWILCMDDAAYRILSAMDLPSVRLVTLAELEEGDPALLAVKPTRSRVEYYFTCTPSLPLYVLGQSPAADLVTYLDADLFFFSEPSPMYDEMADRSVMVIGHRFPDHLRDRERYGVYNVGCLAFRRDREGMACLQWWRDRCIEWCYDREEEGRYADQKYLDQWPHLFEKVAVLQHRGAGLAPWNLARYQLECGRQGIVVSGEPLIFYHFHQLRQLTPVLYDPCLRDYTVDTRRTPWRRIYRPYLRALLLAARDVRRYSGPRLASARALRHDRMSVSSPSRKRFPFEAAIRRVFPDRETLQHFLGGELLLGYGKAVC